MTPEPVPEPAPQPVQQPAAQPARPPVRPDPGWQRLHPLTPLVRGWRVVVVVFAVVAQQRGGEVFRSGGVDGREALVGLGLLLLAAVVGLGYSALAWRKSTYRVDDEALVLRTGVVFRRERQARLDRLQAVDVTEPLLARFAGLAELRLEVAGGSGSGVRLSYLREQDARELRSALLASAAGLQYDAEAGPAPEAPEHVVLEVPPLRVVESVLRSGALVWLVLVGLGLGVGSVLAGGPALLGGLFPALLAAGAVVWARFTTAFGFRVATSPDGVRLRHGLLTSHSQTVPPGRVQAVRLSQPLLWRGRDWWRVEVNVAGYAGRGGDESGRGEENVLLPVGPRAEAIGVLALILPDLGVAADEDPAALVSVGMTGRDAVAGFTTSPRAARWLDPLAWRRNGYRVTDRALLARGGAVVRRLDVVPHERTQSLGLRQGPLQRRLGVASFVLHSTQGPVSPAVKHLSGSAAADLLAAQVERARTARAGERDQRWMVR